MSLSATARHAPPYGLAFDVTELVMVQDWAHRRRLPMTMLLDQVLDGAEFEELLLIRGRARSPMAITIWRTATSVVAQTAGGTPRAFSGVQPALDYFVALLAARAARPALVTRLWRGLMWRDRNCFTGHAGDGSSRA